MTTTSEVAITSNGVELYERNMAVEWSVGLDAAVQTARRALPADNPQRVLLEALNHSVIQTVNVFDHMTVIVDGTE